jgi:hypothetical protein
MSHVAFGVGVCLLDPLSENIGGDTAHLHVVGRQNRGQSLGIGRGIDGHDFHFLGGFINRFAEGGRMRRRDNDRRRVR